MNKPRSGRGTFISFSTLKTGYHLEFCRENGQKLTSIINPETAEQLAETYGVRDRRGADTKSLKSLRGAAFRYQQNSQGMLVKIDILGN